MKVETERQFEIATEIVSYWFLTPSQPYRPNQGKTVYIYHRDIHALMP